MRHVCANKNDSDCFQCGQMAGMSAIVMLELVTFSEFWIPQLFLIPSFSRKSCLITIPKYFKL